MQPATTLNLDALMDPATIANPYPVYAALRDTAPVRWNALTQMWMLARFEDVQLALQDERFSSEWPNLRQIARPLDEDEQRCWGYIMDIFSRMILNRDGPDHQRQRALVHKVFTPRVIQQMRERVLALVTGMIDAVEQRGELDLVRDLALPLPSTIILDMCGVPQHMRAPLRAGSDALVTAFGMANPAPGELAELVRIVRVGEELLRELIAERRAALSDDLLSLLISAEDSGAHLSEEEIISFMYLLIPAGFETTTNLISNSVLALLRHPGQLDLLKRQPDLLDNAVEELLRYDSPVHGIFRLTTENVQIRDSVIPAGSMVMLLLASANRDAAQFPGADRLDITRKISRHVGFALGAHYCLGAPLARLEVKIALTELLRRLPNLRLVSDTVERAPNMVVRPITSLPLAFDPPQPQETPELELVA